MNIDRRITNGLAWAGVLLVVGVPTADLLSAQFLGGPAAPQKVSVAVVERVAPMPAPLSQRPATPALRPAAQVAAVVPTGPATPVTSAVPIAPVEPQVAAVAPAKPATAAPARPAADTADAVNAWLNSGKPLPSYITEAAQPAQVAATAPARPPISTTPAVAPAAPVVDPVQVAAIGPQKTAPVPMPLSMRPAPIAVALVQDPVIVPPGLTPASPAGAVRPPADVTAADLEDWESGPLSEFLAQRQAGNAYVDPAYDADGFFLDQGPNQRPRNRIIPRGDDDAPFFLFD